MSDVAVRIERLSKQYTIGHANGRHDTLRDVLADAGRRAVGRWRNHRGIEDRQRIRKEQFWALKDVSFEVKRGEVVAVVGRNGAGKSTLLKILSRITEPTSGHAALYGRVGSLLEVGTGFHPELSGRENIYLNGAILGMTRAEIQSKFDEIVAFSEVEQFIDTPVKHYSSGMYVRLAFSVAAHLETEILVVDEVLAVGDAAFQKKCLGKMGAIARGGRAVLFVSHNMGVVSTLCHTAHWLENGSLKESGDAKAVVQSYLAQSTASASPTMDLRDHQRVAHHGEKLRIVGVEWMTGLPLRHDESIKVRIEFEVSSPVEEATFGLGFSTLEGVRLLTYETDYQGGQSPSLKAGQKGSVCLIAERLPLAPGVYSLDIGSRSGDNYALDYLAGFAQVEVIPGPHTPGTIVRPGAGVRLAALWEWADSR